MRAFIDRWSRILTNQEAWCIVGGAYYAYEARFSRPVNQLEIRQLVLDAGSRVYSRTASVKQVIAEISPQIRGLMK